MSAELLKRVLDLPVIIQGALGSFLFWIALQLFKAVGRFLMHLLGRTSKSWAHTRTVQEYMYRRYTSRSGYLNILQGLSYGLNEAFKGLLAGLIYCCIALLLGGHSPVIWGICLVAALVYFGSASIWLNPSRSWRHDDMHKNWSRVAELEILLFGEVEKDTQKILDANPPPRPPGAP
jgi:hypothetical protein